MLKFNGSAMKFMVNEMQNNRKFWISILVIFVFGALTSNSAWLYYTNVKDARFEARIGRIETAHEDQIGRQERSHKYQMGQQRTKIERKIDDVIYLLNKAPATPIIIDARETLQEAKKNG